MSGNPTFLARAAAVAAAAFRAPRRTTVLGGDPRRDDPFNGDTPQDRDVGRAGRFHPAPRQPAGRIPEDWDEEPAGGGRPAPRQPPPNPPAPNPPAPAQPAPGRPTGKPPPAPRQPPGETPLEEFLSGDGWPGDAVVVKSENMLDKEARPAPILVSPGFKLVFLTVLGLTVASAATAGGIAFAAEPALSANQQSVFETLNLVWKLGTGAIFGLLGGKAA